MLPVWMISAAAAVTLAGSTLGSGTAMPAHTVPNGAASGTQACTRFKPYLGGVLSRQYPLVSGRNVANAGKVSGFVSQETWAQLEPRRGQYDFAAIDAQLAFAQQHGLRVKLRIAAGMYAPAWAKSVGGTPTPYFDHAANQTGTVGHFWSPTYQAAWQELQSELARRYDTNASLAEVAITGAGAVNGEVLLLFVRDHIPGTSMTNGDSLRRAGYTEAARRAALLGDVSDMQRVWSHTHLDLFTDPYQDIDTVAKPIDVTEGMLAAIDKTDPGHVVMGHTGIGHDAITPSHSHTAEGARELDDWVMAQGHPFDVQTVQASGSYTGLRLGSIPVLMAWLRIHPVLSVELPYGWQDWNSSAKLAQTDAALLQHAAAQRC